MSSRNWYQNKPPVGFGLDWGDPINTGAVGVWLFNEGAGNLTNLAARSQPAALTNNGGVNPSWTDGKFGSSLLFDGVGGYCSTADRDIFSFGNGTTDVPFSISAWIYNTHASGNSFRAISKTLVAASSEAEFLFGTNGVGYYVSLLYGSGASNTQEAQVSSSLASALGDLNRWVFLAATYDGRGGVGAGNGIVLYRNGIVLPSARTSQATYVAMANTAATLNFGAVWPTDATNKSFATGRLDIPRIWRNRVLHPAEILRLYTEPFAGIIAPRRRFATVASAGVTGSPYYAYNQMMAA